MRRKEFNQLLEKRGFQKGRSTGGRYYWFGLGIVDQHRTGYLAPDDDGAKMTMALKGEGDAQRIL